MQILMHRRKNILFTTLFFLFLTGRINAQVEVIEQIGHLINDALFFSDMYITPATDAAVYQSASGWVTSPKKRKPWDVTLGLHTNIFFTPQQDRVLTVNNNDFSFFSLEEGTSATVPTALGNDYQVYLSGQLGDETVRLETPQGINREAIAYPYLQGSVALYMGTELAVKYSPKVRLKKSNYQVYGAGLKHNLSQYIKPLNKNNIHLAALVAYSEEEVSFNFLNVQTSVGSLGIETLTGMVDTWQFQLNGSKEFGKFEAMGGFIINTSNVRYTVSGEKGSIEDIISLQQILNNRLEEIYKTRVNYIGEASLAYNINNFSVQTILAFGKFVNTNVSLQYTFN